MNPCIPAILPRRDFLTRSALLSGAGLLAGTACSYGAPAASSTPAPSSVLTLKDLPKLTVRKNIQIASVDGREALLTPAALEAAARPKFNKAQGDLEWLARDLGSGKIEKVQKRAEGLVYVPAPSRPEGTLQGTLIGMVINALSEANVDLGRYGHFYADDAYYLPSDDEMKNIVPEIMGQSVGGISLGAVAPIGNVPGRFDCDDFAFAMKGLVSMRQYRDTQNGALPYAFGIITGDFVYIGEKHAVCFYVNKEKMVRFVDPRHQALAGVPAALSAFGLSECKKCSMILM